MLPPRDQRLVAALDANLAGWPGFAPLARTGAALIGARVPHDGFCLFAMDPLTHLMGQSTAAHAFSDAAYRRLIDLEIDGHEPNRFLTLGAARAPVAALGPADHARSERLRAVLAPAGYGHEARLVLRHGGTSWGALALFRARGERGFSPAELATLAAASGPLARAVAADALAATSAETAAPEVLLVNADDGIAEASIGARAALADLGPAAAGLPFALHGLVALARRGRAASVRVGSRGRRALTLTATALDPGSRVAVTVTPTPARDRARLWLAAQGLTARQEAVATLVLEGLSTRLIARRLGVSSYTVQDHCKGIFAKLAVRSREDLVARAGRGVLPPRRSARA